MPDQKIACGDVPERESHLAFEEVGKAREGADGEDEVGG
jgi:hypothetical protein